MPLTKDQILDQLRQIQDPQKLGDIVSLNMVGHVAVCEGRVSVAIKLPAAAASSRESIRGVIEKSIYDLPDVKQVQVDFEVSLATPPESPESPEAPGGGAGKASGGGNPLPDIKHIIAVGAGKGGVGKSTLAVNLAVGLARTGLKVGLMDGDIYGPSLPTMLGLNDQKPAVEENTLHPFTAHGIKSMTIGVLVEEDKPLIWRGPMAHGAFRQLATQTAWGELDYLIVDLPPGTGDVPLTMSQLLTVTGAVVVCTPQKVAQDDARRAIGMFQQLGVEVLGIVENMSYFIGDDGKEYDLFGKGGAEMMAQQTGLPFLGNIPINTNLRRNCDAGNPTANFESDDQLAAAFNHIATQLQQQVSVASLDQPTLTIS